MFPETRGEAQEKEVDGIFPSGGRIGRGRR